MKKSKYQQYFYCFIVWILGPFAFWFRFQKNIVTVLISAVYRSATLIRGEALTSMWIPQDAALIRGNKVSTYLSIICLSIALFIFLFFLSLYIVYDILYIYVYHILYIYIYIYNFFSNLWRFGRNRNITCREINVLYKAYIYNIYI